MFETNGNIQKVILRAYGQNAHYFHTRHDSTPAVCDETWTDDLPYVIWDNLVVPSGCSLTIKEGVKVYSHSKSFLVVAGNLSVEGTQQKPVIFTGDRLEQIYKNVPAQWGGIYITKEGTANITHAIISNAIIGIRADSQPVRPTVPNLVVQKTIIKNMSVAGIAGYSSTIQGTNLLVYRCGQATFAGLLGGDYDFVNCTFDDADPPIDLQNPSFYADNADYPNGKLPEPLKLQLRNCIVWGVQDDEMLIKKAGSGPIDTTFDYNFIRSAQMRFTPTNKRNVYPKFKDYLLGKYQPDTLSPLINAGKYFDPPHLVNDDIEDVTRDSAPDVGAYEKK
jgi:hypothetical protein